MHTRSSGPVIEEFASAESDIESEIETENMAFDLENGTDDPGAQAKMGSVKTAFDSKDPEFFFLDLEAAMAYIGVKSQYTKRFCLMSLLPPETKRELKATIKASTTENGYKKLKDAILKTYGPKPGQNVAKAASLMLVGKPSTLATELISLICKHATPLENCCCEDVVIYFWHKQLSNSVKIKIAGRSMKGENNLEEVLQLADEVHASTTRNTSSGQVAAAEVDSSGQEVSAMTRTRGRGGARGRGRGRGQGWANQTRQNGANQSSQSWGPRSPDNPPDGCCRAHWKWGLSAYYCSDRAVCPWKDRIMPRPVQQQQQQQPQQQNKPA